MNNSYITIIKEKRTALSRNRIPLNQNGCTADSEHWNALSISVDISYRKISEFFSDCHKHYLRYVLMRLQTKPRKKGLTSENVKSHPFVRSNKNSYPESLVLPLSLCVLVIQLRSAPSLISTASNWPKK